MQKKTGRKKYLIPAIIIVLLVVARAMLPVYAFKKTNEFLATFSPNMLFHIDDMDISIIRGAYRFENIIGKLKENNQAFITIESVDVSLAWRELFRGKLLTDIVANQADFLLIKDIKKLSIPKKETNDVKEKLFPLEIERLDLKDSSVTIEVIQSLTDESRLKIGQINGRISNLTPNENLPISFFNLTANMINPEAPFKAAGGVNLIKKPFTWDLDLVVKEFNLKTLNPYFKKHIPLTFTRGALDVYSEVNSQDGKIKGYVKPFFKEIDVIANREQFKNLKHIGIELITALANIILDNPQDKSVATVIDFQYDKKLTIDKKKTLSKALEHGFKQELKPGIEERYKSP